MRMSSTKLVLFDLPSKGRCACWSLNPWKTRLALNFKAIDYETEWVEYPDIEERLKHLVVANDASHNPMPYCIPSVRLTSGEYLMDSKIIAARLEEVYPSPAMHLDSHILRDVERLVAKQQETLRAVWMPDIPANLLNPISAEYFETTRSKRFGKPLAQLKKENGGEEAWMEALPALKELAKIISLESGGPFCMGHTPSYADFVIVSWLHFLNRIDSNMYTKIATIDECYEKLYSASKKWLERDDH